MRLAIFTLLMLLSAAAVFANVAEQRQALNKVRARITQVSQKIEQLRTEQNSLLGQLATIEKQAGKIASARKQTSHKIASKQRRMRQIRKQIVLLKGRLKQQNEQLQGQIRAAYALGQKQRLKLIMNQQDTALSSRILIYYSYFNKAKLEKITLIKHSLLLLNGLETELRQEADKLTRLLQRKNQEQQKLAAAKHQREMLLVKLDGDVSAKQQKLSSLTLNEKKLRKLLDLLQQAHDDFPLNAAPSVSFSRQKGKLAWPVKGKLLQRFGSRRLVGRWDGVLIAAPEGTEVHVVTYGHVVYSDWLRGYGLLIIVDHGKKYMTLYAFNQSLYKEKGDWVDAGDIIASVGKSGGRNRAGLYFGIRKNGKPVDPVKWCKKT